MSWATTYKLTTTKESNNNNSWYGWVVEFDQYLNDPKFASALEAAKGFYEGAKKSDIFGKVDFNQEETVEATSSESVPF